MTVFRHAIHPALIIVLAFLAGDGPGSAASGREINGGVNATLDRFYTRKPPVFSVRFVLIPAGSAPAPASITHSRSGAS